MIMTREESKAFYPILQAFAEGKVIECRTKPGTISTSIPNEWTEMKEIGFWNGIEYRIKQEPKYRPFANAEECLAEMQKHQLFGWVENQGLYRNIANIMSCSITFADNEARYVNYEQVFKNYTFADGTPFGVKIEDDYNGIK